jgi:DNA-binding transcriptional MerR regulator
LNATAELLNVAGVAKRLGISPKALRLYEERGLLKPMRSAAGWRTYGSEQMARATEIVELRSLGLSIAEISRVLDGDASVLVRALAAHEANLEARARQLHESVQKVRRLRSELERGAASVASVVATVRQADRSIDVAFDLPWPWGGERFALRELRRLTHIVGPLGSGKTRLAMRLAEAITGAVFVSLDRLKDGSAAAKDVLASDPQLATRVHRSVGMILEAGGKQSDALIALVTALETHGPTVQIIDMLEDGLDAPTQEALICVLRRHAGQARPLMFLTRSSSILDPELVGPDETIILCPANHSPPMFVAPHCGAAGYEALTTCLATPAVRARTEGVIAVRRSA